MSKEKTAKIIVVMPKIRSREFEEQTTAVSLFTSTALPKSLRPGQARSPFDDTADVTKTSSSDTETTPEDGESIGGLEYIVPRRPSRQAPSSPSDELVARSHRDLGVLAAKHNVYEDIANKSLPPEGSEWMIKRLEKRADERLQRTYVEGVPLNQVFESAMVLDVGLTFLPGADKPQVTRIEQQDMAGQEPEQKDANWRVNTAGSLLVNFDVSADLSIVQVDQTAKIVEKVKSRLQKRDTLFPDQRKSLTIRGRPYEAVTIDSERVKIVRDLRGRPWDVQSTLIEVDGGSLLNLIVNCRHLIANGGPDMTFDETSMLLETMIEDARRLCVRSPILFRMSTRAKIINSKNTRYGVDHKPMFQTLTTSKGIKEIISLSASYYNSLDPAGEADSAQKYIRPRFLQMIVLLLSLLNDDDLDEISEFLEATYKLKADRRHLEMLFLKVIPLLSINSKVFLNALVPAFEGFSLKNDEEHIRSHSWNVFIQRTLEEGYLLPGGVADLGRDNFSWIVKWPDDGFKSTSVFSNLQYVGRLRTINDIPPIEFHPESSLSELTVILTNGNKYTIGATDLEQITCLTPGTYTVNEAGPGGKRFDLIIEEYPINGDLHDAIKNINIIIHQLNAHLANPRKYGTIKGRILGRSMSESFLNEFKGSGKLTKNIARLNNDILATAYKVEGRKFTRTDSVRNMTRDLQQLQHLIKYIERRTTDLDYRPSNDHKQSLKQALESVKDLVGRADVTRHAVGDADEMSDEPIARCLYPGGGEVTEKSVWSNYTAWYTQFTIDQGFLHIEGKTATVSKVSWLSEVNIEVGLSGHAIKYFVTPLKPVEEGCRNDEVRIGDIAILAGQYMIIAEIPENYKHPSEGILMTNYLRVTNVEEQYRSRRGQNRRPEANATVLNLLR